ncbi:MAG TPA: TolC family protein [Gemmatimonadaceae bacterium]|nr:TolC family protein [Gemmatimonadaceae bacterium]
MGVAVVLLLVARPGVAPAQPSEPAPDTLRLGILQAEAVRRDPRARQLELLGATTALRLRSLDAERLPAVSLDAQGQYQSDVVTIPFALPGGAAPPLPPHDSYDAHVGARQRLYDPTRAARRDVERAQLAESRARVQASLYALRQRVNEAFFGAMLARAQQAELEAGLTDLEARLRIATARVQGGTALPGEAAAIEAELLRRRQSLAELAAARRAALVVLADLTGRTIAERDTLALPDLAVEVARARDSLGQLRARPEYEQFARSRELLERQREVAAAQDAPRVSAFGRAGYGRPGLNPLGRDFDEYWLAGVQVEWTPWSWGSTDRARQELALQQQVVATEEAAFAESVRRGVATDLATIDRLQGALATDDEIVALRERVLRETRLRFDEGVVTAAEYVDRETDLLAARLARATHRVELAQARARFLTTVGLEVR